MSIEKCINCGQNFGSNSSLLICSSCGLSTTERVKQIMTPKTIEDVLIWHEQELFKLLGDKQYSLGGTLQLEYADKRDEIKQQALSQIRELQDSCLLTQESWDNLLLTHNGTGYQEVNELFKQNLTKI